MWPNFISLHMDIFSLGLFMEKGVLSPVFVPGTFVDNQLALERCILFSALYCVLLIWFGMLESNTLTNMHLQHIVKSISITPSLFLLLR